MAPMANTISQSANTDDDNSRIADNTSTDPDTFDAIQLHSLTTQFGQTWHISFLTAHRLVCQIHTVSHNESGQKGQRLSNVYSS